mmetsp:Transcript_39347/g.99166  ORF Transcript_39347/g.99166 Transcript_39347/m.99166 type:complete len:275 (-) Transcript_39347:171-995(-)
MVPLCANTAATPTCPPRAVQQNNPSYSPPISQASIRRSLPWVTAWLTAFWKRVSKVSGCLRGRRGRAASSLCSASTSSLTGQRLKIPPGPFHPRVPPICGWSAVAPLALPSEHRCNGRVFTDCHLNPLALRPPGTSTPVKPCPTTTSRLPPPLPHAPTHLPVSRRGSPTVPRHPSQTMPIAVSLQPPPRHSGPPTRAPQPTLPQHSQPRLPPPLPIRHTTPPHLLSSPRHPSNLGNNPFTEGPPTPPLPRQHTTPPHPPTPPPHWEHHKPSSLE